MRQVFRSTFLRSVFKATFSIALAWSLASAQIYSLRTTELQLLSLDPAHAYIVPHLASCFHNAINFHHRHYDYYPTDGVIILLQDFNDFGHGGTSSMPWNSLSIGIEPFDYAYETMPANERMNWLMNHELIHLLTTDKASSTDRTYRSIFSGKVMTSAEHPITMLYSYLTNPRWYSPRWYHEGYAVFMETWLSGGMGRALGGYDEMVFRTMVADSSYFYGVVGLESEGTTVDFQVGQNSYLYGTRFVTYLADRYGIDRLERWFNRTDSSDAYFSSQFESVYGTPLSDEWSRWTDFEHEWQRGNLDSIRAFPVTAMKPVLGEALGSVSRAFFDPAQRRLYTAVNFPGEVAHVASIDVDRGTVRTICDVPTPALYYVASLAYDPTSGTIFFTTHNSRDWRDLNAVNVHTGEVQLLSKRCRAGDLAFNPADKSVWGVQHHDGYSTIVRFAPPYDKWQNVLKLEYGKDMFNLDISPDAKMMIASLVNLSGHQELVALDPAGLLEGRGLYETLHDFGDTAPESFVFTSDGRYLFGTSYFTGVSNIWRYDIAAKKMDIVSNCETGLFRPVPITNDTLVAFRYSGKGFTPVVLRAEVREDVKAIKFFGQDVAEKHPVVTTWPLPSPTLIKLDSLSVSKDNYRSFSDIRVAGLYPIVEGFQKFAAFGLRGSLMDGLGLTSIDLAVSYTPNLFVPKNERLHASLAFSHYPWKITATHNRADFYDLFGPTKVSRAGTSLAVEYRDNLLNERPQSLDFSVRTAGYWRLSQLPEFQNVVPTYDNFYTLSAGLDYSSLLRSLGAVEYERGITAGLHSYNTYQNSLVYPRIYGTLDYGILLPILHSSFWLRTAAGTAIGHRNDPAANFYFGGFGNNWIDHQEARRFREYSSFPGVEIDEIGGVNFSKVLAEWTLPPVRFREFGVPSFYVNWVQMMLFSSGVVTNLDDRATKREAVNLGAQLDVRLVMFSLLESTFSFGFAEAVERNGRPSHEVMASLKILR